MLIFRARERAWRALDPALDLELWTAQRDRRRDRSGDFLARRRKRRGRGRRLSEGRAGWSEKDRGEQVRRSAACATRE